MLYWLLSGEALQRRLVREIREARTPLTALAPRAKASAAETPKSLSIAPNGVATIRVEGVLTPSPDPMAEYYGEANTTYDDLRAALAGATSNPDVSEIVWSIDSPGGSVDGYFALLDDIAEARAAGANMRVEASEAQSAAYGIAAAAGKITATSRTASFGSIGVATSGFVQGGLCGKVVDMTNSDSPDKRPNIETPEGKAVVVAYLDQLAAEFMTAIANGRGTSADAIAKGYGRGSSMLATAAKAAGLIDAIASRPQASARTTLTNVRTQGSVRASMADEPQPTEAPVPEAPKPTEPEAPAPVVADPTETEAPEAPAADPAPVEPTPAASAAPTRIVSAEDFAELAALRAERTARTTAERRALVTELVALGAETPATAWANGAPVPRLATETLESLRARVDALRTTKPAAVAPPAGAELAGLSEVEAEAAQKIKDPEHRARFIARRRERAEQRASAQRQ